MSGRGGGGGSASSTSSPLAAAAGTTSGRSASPRGASQSPAGRTSTAGGTGRGQRGRPPKSPASSPVKRRLSLSESDATATPAVDANKDKPRSGRKHRRPKFQDNPPAPEIVEKRALKATTTSAPASATTSPINSGDASSRKAVMKAESSSSSDDDHNRVASNGHHAEDGKNNGAATGKKRAFTEDEADENAKKVKLTPDADGTINSAVEGIVSEVIDKTVGSEVQKVTDREMKNPNCNGDLDDNDSEASKKLANILREILIQAVKTFDEGGEETPKSVSELRSTLVKFASKALEKASPAIVVASSATLHKMEEVKVILDCFLSGELVPTKDQPGGKSSHLIKTLMKEDKTMQIDRLKADVIKFVLDGAQTATSATTQTMVLTTDTIVPLSKVEKSMVPVDSVQIEDLSCEGLQMKASPTKSQPTSPSKAPPAFDKSKLFLHMEDKFAKETQNALKNKPAYRRKSGKESTDQSPSAKIVSIAEPGEMAKTAKTAAAAGESEDEGEAEDEEDEEEDEEHQSDEKQLKTASSAQDFGGSPGRGSTSTGGSELTKSLRKVRVRRSRTNSSSNQEPPALASQQQQQDSVEARTTSDGDEKPPKLELEVKVKSPPNSPLHSGSRLIRPRILLSPNKTAAAATTEETEQEHLSEKKSSVIVSQPLQIEIPPSRYSTSSSSSSSTAKTHSSNSNTTQQTISQQQQRLLMRAAEIESVEIGPTVLSQSDAANVAFAVQISPVPAESSSNGHPSLKTVIRLPPKTSAGGKKKGRRRGGQTAAAAAAAAALDGSDRDSDVEETRPRRKRRRIFVENNSNSAEAPSPTQDQVVSSSNDDRLMGDGGPASDEDGEKPNAAAAAAAAAAPGGGAAAAPEVRTRTPEQGAADGTGGNLSMVVPEKASSFNIHPERCCSDMCHYCGTKFGLLDTPLHVSQLKTPAIQKFAREFATVTSDACLCDKCFRFIDRKARFSLKNNPHATGSAVAAALESRGVGGGGGGGAAASLEASAGPPPQEEKIRTCLVRNCNREVTSTVSKKWLIRLRKRLIRKVHLNWDRVSKGSTKATFPICHKHSALVDTYSQCGLCKNKLKLSEVCALGMTDEEVEALNVGLRTDSVPAELTEHSFVCKPCKAFCGVNRQKAVEQDYLKNHKNHKAFYKEHRKKLHQCLGLETDGYSTESAPSPKKIHQVSQSDNNPTKITIKTTTLESSASASAPANERPSRKRKTKEFASPNSEARIHVLENSSPPPQASTSSGNGGGKAGTAVQTGTLASGSTAALSDGMEKCSVTIQFDMNTKKLWQDLHYPYGNYTSFFRHLILLEKYWRNGDLTLAPNSSPKASVYVKSVRNRIDAYESKHKRSAYDLSVSTRPDLNVPSAPVDLIPVENDNEVEIDDDEDQEQEIPAPGTAAASANAGDSSTILKIPKVPIPVSNSSPLLSGALNAPASNLPTKIRVRKDLMHLGLMARGAQETPPPSRPASSSPAVGSKKKKETSPSTFNIADLVSTSRKTPSAASTPTAKQATGANQSNLLQLLNDPPVAGPKGPLLGNTSLIGSGKSTSSNSSNKVNQPEAVDSSAIPLTFNNSIAEVLAAAAGKSNSKSGQRTVSSTDPVRTPEVTITSKQVQAKSVVKTSSTPKSSLPDLSSMCWSEEEIQRVAATVSATVTKTNPANLTTTSATGSSMLPSASPSGGGVSIQRGELRIKSFVGSIPKGSAAKNLNSSTGVSNISQIHPLMDMSKLLQSQAPGVAPHIIAQNTLPASGTRPPSSATSSPAGGPSPSSLSKISPKPGPLPAKIRPVQLNKSATSATPPPPAPPPPPPQGIQTVNKKSLNTVLDRLSGLKAPSSAGGNSSLVQQLQAPPMSSLPKSPKPKSAASAASSTPTSAAASTASNSSSAAAAAAAAMAASNAASALNPFMTAASFGTIGQPMVQYPWAAAAMNQQQAQAAQAALLMSALGPSSMNSVQAAAAMQELMKMSLQQQQQQQQQHAASSKASPTSPASSRIRAPPPLTHMGRPSNSGNPSNKPKSD